MTGAVPGANNANQPWYLLGDGTQYHTRQDHLKLKLAYDLTPTLRASYVLGVWQNEAAGDAGSYLRDGDGAAGLQRADQHRRPLRYSRADRRRLRADREKLTHTMHGLSIKSHTQGTWDWEVAASLYDYDRDDKRQNAAANTAAGRRQRRRRHPGRRQRHRLEHAGRSRASGGRTAPAARTSSTSACSRTATSCATGPPASPATTWAMRPGALVSERARRHAGCAASTPRTSGASPPAGSAVLGGRAERWQASDGLTAFSAQQRRRPIPTRQRDLLLAQGRAVLAVAARHRAQGLGRPRGAHADRGRALRRDLDHQFAVHQRSEPAPEQSWTGELSAESGSGPRQRWRG